MAFVEIFRSPNARVCEQRAFVLRAVGIASDILMHDGAYLLFVNADAEVTAREQLELFERENSAPIAKPPPVEALPRAVGAPLLYILVLLACAYFAGENSFRFDWYDAGSLTSGVTRSNQWWRAITALTLHADHAHLVSNLGFGALFYFVAARLLGFGVALASAVLAAIAGNLIDSALMPDTHIVVGASTIVFAVLGLISAYSWRIRLNPRSAWAHRWAPLIVGVMLLGFFGSAGENTDLLGHLAGFFCGLVAGVGLAQLPPAIFKKNWLQYLTAGGVLAIFALGWMWAALS